MQSDWLVKSLHITWKVMAAKNHGESPSSFVLLSIDDSRNDFEPGMA